MDTGKMNKMVQEYNTLQLAERKGLPTLADALIMCANGDTEIFQKFFYTVQRVDTYTHEGSKRAEITAYMKFWDKGINSFLISMKDKYASENVIGFSDSYSGGSVSVKSNVKKFDTDEIDAMFYEHMKKFANAFNIEKFYDADEGKTLNNVRKYIRIDFENNVLKTEYNKRMDIDRVMVDGETYYVKHGEEEIYFDDIYCGQDENGDKVSFLDMVVEENHVYGKTDTGLFVVENYESVLTKKQLDKLDLLMAHVREHGVDGLFQKNNPSAFNKSALSRILFPDRNPSSTMKEVNSFLDSMSGRMDKALVKAGLVDNTPIAEVKATKIKSATKDKKFISPQEFRVIKEGN